MDLALILSILRFIFWFNFGIWAGGFVSALTDKRKYTSKWTVFFSGHYLWYCLIRNWYNKKYVKKWYEVKTIELYDSEWLFDNVGFYNFKILPADDSDFDRYQTELNDYVNNNTTKYPTPAIVYYVIGFVKEADAVAFKLKFA